MRTRWHVLMIGPAAAAAVLAVATVAHADDKAAPTPRVAVRSFAAKGVDPAIAATLETSFCSQLAGFSMDVLCPDDLNAIVAQKQQELGVGACDNEDECIKNLANISHSNRVVTGEVAKIGDTFQISVTMIDVSSSRVVGRAIERTNKVEDLLNKLPDLAKKLVSGQK